MKRFVAMLLVIFLLTCVTGCGEKKCYLCEETYTGKSYDYPTFGGPPEHICKKCYEKYLCFECEECHKLIEGDYHQWPVVLSPGSENKCIKLCNECFDKKMDFNRTSKVAN